MFTLLSLLRESMLFFSYVKSNSFPEPLSKEDEAKYLSLMFEGDQFARQKLIEHNLRLVAHITKKYDSKKDLNEDIISIGTVGLIKGVDSFSADKGTKLATYAARCIENEILMHFRSTKKTLNDVSLHDIIGQDKDGSEISLIDVIPADIPETIDTIHLSDNISRVMQYIEILDEREKEILCMRYGLFGTDELTQKEIAKLYKISRSYVSRIEKRALMKLLREFMRNNQV